MVNFGSNFVKTSTEANATVTIDDVVGTNRTRLPNCLFV